MKRILLVVIGLFVLSSGVCAQDQNGSAEPVAGSSPVLRLSPAPGPPSESRIPPVSGLSPVPEPPPVSRLSPVLEPPPESSLSPVLEPPPESGLSPVPEPPPVSRLSPGPVPPPKPALGKDKEWTVSANYWYESRGRDRFLQEYFTVISGKEMDIFVEQLQTSKKHFQRFRFHYGNLYLHKSEDATVMFRPGVIFDTLGTTQFGGRLSIRFPKAKLSIVHNGYVGNHFDRHQTFIEGRPHDNFGVLLYQLADKRGTPTTVIGPKLYLGKKAYMYYGMPLNSNKRTLIWVGGKFDF